MEKFANRFRTTVGGGGITNVATSLPVSDAAPAALQNGEFRIRVGTQSEIDAGTAEIMIVTATGASGASPWTVTRGAEGTIAAAHNAGDIIKHVLTTGGLGFASGGGLPAGSGLRYIPRFANNSHSYVAPTLSREYCTPIWLPAATLNLLGTHIDTAAGAGGVVRLGLREVSAGQPGRLLFGSSGISTTTNNNKTVDPALTLAAAGWYYTCVVFQVAAPVDVAMAGGPVVGMPQRTYTNSPMHENSAAAWYQDSITGALGTYSAPADPVNNVAPIVAVGLA